MKNGSRLVPEFRVTKQTRRAGFVPSYDEQEVETWQVWCKNVDGSEDRRATRDDMRAAGFKKRKR